MSEEERGKKLTRMTKITMERNEILSLVDVALGEEVITAKDLFDWLIESPEWFMRHLKREQYEELLGALSRNRELLLDWESQDSYRVIRGISPKQGEIPSEGPPK